MKSLFEFFFFNFYSLDPDPNRAMDTDLDPESMRIRNTEQNFWQHCYSICIYCLMRAEPPFDRVLAVVDIVAAEAVEMTVRALLHLETGVCQVGKNTTNLSTSTWELNPIL